MSPLRSLASYYIDAKKQIVEEINKLSHDELNKTSIDEWVDFFVKKYSFTPITLLDGPLLMSVRTEQEVAPGILGPVKVDHDYVTIGLRMEPNADFPMMQHFQASFWHIIPWPTYSNGYLMFEISENTEASIKNRIKLVKENMQNLNKDIAVGNEELPPLIRQRLEARMDSVGARRQRILSLAESLGAELQLSPAVQSQQKHLPAVKTAIAQLRRPTARTEEPLRLQPDEFRTIFETINNQCLNFERTPNSLIHLGEEDIRSLLLATLNGTFNLGAQGEAFSNQGKTDIFLRVPKGAVFIAEAKIWGGPATIKDALGQILGYLTWRDGYGLVLLFSRNTRFENVKTTIPNAIKAEPSLRGDLHQESEAHWVARHALPSAEHERVEIHYVVYNIYSPKATITE